MSLTLLLGAERTPPAPLVTGQIAYTVPGTYTWVCPEGVTSVSVVCVGGGGYAPGLDGGGGGALAYKNTIPVIPGNSYTVVVGNYNQSSTFNTTLVAGGGNGYTAGQPSGHDGGGSGGAGGIHVGYWSGGGGGAGGYSGAGGTGGQQWAGGAGTGGGGGGGGSTNSYNGVNSGTGGGVGLLGQGSSGAGGHIGSDDPPGNPGGGGGGGSGGAAGVAGSYPGAYGGGYAYSGATQGGAVRIIWPGNARTFPSTRTGNEWAAGTPAMWDGLTAARVALTANNLTAACTASAGGGVRSDFPLASGKAYWENHIDAGTGSVLGGFGVGNVNSGIGPWPGGDTNGLCALVYAGTVYVFGAGTYLAMYGVASAVGDVYAIALDVTNRTIEFFHNNTSLGTPIGISWMTGDLYAIYTCNNASNAATANFGPTMLYTPPSGFPAGFLAQG